MQTNKKEIKKEFDKSQAIRKIAIVGLPNTGKSQVFNFITGEYTIVANYPLTTVEMKRTRRKIGEQVYEIIDTPGLHSLYIHSEEEIVIRDMLFSEKPDILIQCIDANQLKQSLVLTADLAELGIPMMISLNAVKETAKKGFKINSGLLSQTLGIPVVEITSLHDRGKEKLSKAVEKAAITKINLHYKDTIEKSIAEIEAELPEKIFNKHKKAVLLLENDHFIIDDLKKECVDDSISSLKEKIDGKRESISGDIGRLMNIARDSWVNDIYERVVKKQRGEQSKLLQGFAHLCRHPVFGIPIVTGFVFITYLLVVHVAGFLDRLLSAILLDPVLNFITGIIPSGFWHEFFVGQYGVLTLGLFNALVTILPILSVFFLVFGFMEDIGYIPNLCVLTNRIFKKIGITGKSIMSLILGFGCKTMATLTTRGLQSRKEKFIAIYLIAFAIPCSPQLGLSMAILGKIGIRAFFIAFGTLVLVEILAGSILNKIIKDDKQSDFIQELPPIRIPDVKAIVVKTYYRLIWFLKEAIPIFIIAAAALFFFDKSGGLDIVKKVFSPIVVGWLGLPVDMIDAIILTIARHEAAAGMILKMTETGSLNYIQCIVAVVITTMFVPCFANAVAMFKEVGFKTGIIMYLLINISAFILAGILNWILVFTIGG